MLGGPATAAPSDTGEFTIYAFVPWQKHMEGGTSTATPALSEYLNSRGVKPINVVYDKYYLDDNQQPDEAKIKLLAEKMAATPNIPVSFDTEFGNRFVPATVIPRVLTVLDLFRRYNKSNKYGVYATAPQNTYGWRGNAMIYDLLNPKYHQVADKVDFLSPVLYNYTGKDIEKWKKSAKYNIDAAKQYGTGKPIVPYITPTYFPEKIPAGSDSRVPVTYLTEQEMRDRIAFLKENGASGCIIWASSREVDGDGNPPVFDEKQGWGKAVVEMLKH